VGAGDVRKFYEEVRASLGEVEREIIGHPILRDAEERRLGVDAIRRLAINQWYIVNHDLRSLAIMLSRSSNMEELSYFRDAVEVDYRALQGLVELLRELGLETRKPSEVEASPAAVAYTHHI